MPNSCGAGWFALVRQDFRGCGCAGKRLEVMKARGSKLGSAWFCHVLPISGFYLGLRAAEVPPSVKEVLHSGYLAALRVGGVRFRGPSRHRLRTELRTGASALRIGGDHPERKETLRTGGKALRRGGASDEASERRCLRKGVLVPSEQEETGLEAGARECESSAQGPRN